MKRSNQKKLRGFVISIVSALLLLLMGDDSWAQNSKTITGVVKDSKGSPLNGASVIVKGTPSGTATGADGKYSLSVTGENAVLVISYAGYQNREIPVKNLTTIDVVLTETNANLSEVGVKGYSRKLKREVTGGVP